MPVENGNGSTKDQRSFTQDEVMKIVANATLNATYAATSRARLAKAFSDPRRSINDECGYPDTDQITIQEYLDLYDRVPEAARVVEVLPRESWLTQPTVYENEDPDTVTLFEEAWDALGQNLAGAGYYRTEGGNPVWEYLMRADVRCGIGRFGVILLGLDDGKPLSEPANGIDEHGQKSGNIKERKLLYLRVLDEGLVGVSRFEADRNSPRYGQPVEYSITLNRYSDLSSGGGMGLGIEAMNVHWSRVVHVVDNLGSSEVFGVPRMRPVYDPLCDIRKVRGSSAEMYYKGAFPGWSLEADPSLLAMGAKLKFDDSSLKDQVENWENGLQRILYLKGLTMKGLGTQVVDPTSQIDVQINSICILLAIPRRIFEGSERGELSSSQDKGTWNGRLMSRQRTQITPRIIVPFVDRLILLGVLPEPEEYFVDWPDLAALTDLEQASLAVQRTDAITRYVQGQGESLIAPLDFLTRVLPYTEEEAREMLDAATEAVEEEQVQQQEIQAEQARIQAKAMKAAGIQPPQPGQPPVSSQPPVPGRSPSPLKKLTPRRIKA